MRDESAEDVRVVFEPRARTVDPAVMMESLFRLTELETRFPMNMNVLVDGVVPRVLALPRRCGNGWTIAATCCCGARATGWRRSSTGSKCSRGMLIVFLNLDEVIRIIREEDEPKDALKARFELTDVQANYILDTRLRSLRRLEEMQLKARTTRSARRRPASRSLLVRRKQAVEDDRVADPRGEEEIRRRTKNGKRRTTFEIPPGRRTSISTEAMIEREPVTVVVARRAGSARSRAIVPDLTRCSSRATTRCCPRSSPRRRRRSCCSPPTARCSRSRRRNCRAGAASASPCG